MKVCHKNRLSLLIIICLIMGFTNRIPGCSTPEKIYAAGSIVTNTAAIKSIKDLDISMDKGVITIKATSKAATTDIRYRTLGFTVSTKNQIDTVTAKDYTGPAAPQTPNGAFYLNSAQKIPGKPVNGLTTTTFIFTKEMVQDALVGVLDLDNLSNDTTLYFNAIFQTYKIENGKEVILTKEIINWASIMNDQWWGEDTYEGFAKYYNIDLGFSPGLQENTLYFDYDNQKKEQEPLDSKNINDTVSWNNKVSKTITIDSKLYNLIGYYVEPKLSGVTISGTTKKYLSDGATVTEEKIIAGTAKVPYGGLNVHMVYEKELDPPTLYKSTLYYKYNNITYKVTDLEEKLPGKIVSWASVATQNTPTSIIGAGNYQLQGYYIEPIKANTKLQGVTSLYKAVDNIEDKDIINGKAIVVKGGLKVYLDYDNAIITPTPTPTPGVTPTPIPTIPTLVIPEGGSESQPVSSVLSTGMVKADIRGQERFVVETGIPTTESLYTEVDTTNYLIGYGFEKEVVVKEYPVKVSKTYNLTWTDAKDKTKVVTDKKTITQTVTIKRACAYWVINNFKYYVIDHATIYNDALPGKESTMYPNSSYYNIPSAITYHSESESYHITDPEGVKGIVLPSENLTSTNGSMPVIPTKDFTYDTNALIGEIKVRNDTLTFDGKTVMNNNLYNKETPALTNLSVLNATTQKAGINVLYKANQIIEPTLANETYNSTGIMVYKSHASSVSASNTRSNAIINLNCVVVHTPVICDPKISANNKSYVQLIDPEDDYVPLVLDPNSSLSDFTVSISNTGKHSARVGYGFYDRDMAWSLRSPNVVSYLAQKNDFYRNEVRFPFDVYKKSTSGEDEFIPKNIWIRIAFNTPKFYLPMWVEEGKYTVDFRSISVNATTYDKQELYTEVYANTKPYNYVATNTVKVQVSGRIYGLTIMDVSNERDWDEIFHYKGTEALKIDGNYESGVTKKTYNKLFSYDYTVGVKNQYGINTGRLSKFTFPLINGSNPKWTNIGLQKTGYSVSFKLTTIGSRYGSGDSVLIRPKFYYVDAQGKNRQEVDIYYSQYFNNKSHDLVKMGGTTDKANINSFHTDELQIPKEQLKTMADIFDIPINEYNNQYLPLFTYKRMQIYYAFRTFTNSEYLHKVVISDEYSEIKAAKIKQQDIMQRMQTWYGEYWFPADVHVVAKGYDVLDYSVKKGISYDESFWLTGGYIIINFDIVTLDSNGKELLSYTNTENALNGYCSMWDTEDPVDYKVSDDGTIQKPVTFYFKPGDFMVYYSDHNLREDYTTYIID